MFQSTLSFLWKIIHNSEGKINKEGLVIKNEIYISKSYHPQNCLNMQKL